MSISCLAVKDFNEIGAYFCQSDGCYPFDEHYHAPAALSLDFYEVTLGTIEHASMHTHFGAFGDVYFIGAKVGDVFVPGIGYGNELLHLAVGNGDRDVSATYRTGVVLQEIDSLFDGFDCLFGGVDEYQVVYGRGHFALFCSVAFINKRLFHRHEAFDAFFVEELLCDEFATVRGAHGKPDECVVFVHCDCNLFFIPMFLCGYILGSLMVMQCVDHQVFSF